MFSVRVILSEKRTTSQYHGRFYIHKEATSDNQLNDKHIIFPKVICDIIPITSKQYLTSYISYPPLATPLPSPVLNSTFPLSVSLQHSQQQQQQQGTAVNNSYLKYTERRSTTCTHTLTNNKIHTSYTERVNITCNT